MKLETAIEELSRYRKEPYSNLHPYFSEAVDLGIEALKRLYEHRDEYYFDYDLPLPGETED